jgi:hypothetical protein
MILGSKCLNNIYVFRIIDIIEVLEVLELNRDFEGPIFDMLELLFKHCIDNVLLQKLRFLYVIDIYVVNLCVLITIVYHVSDGCGL